MLLINFYKKALAHLFTCIRFQRLTFFLCSNMKLIYLLSLVIGLSFSGYTQNIDSLLVAARQTKDDSAKIRMLNKIAFSYIFNNTDKALDIISEGKALAKASQFKFGLTELTNTHGIYMDVTGQSDSAGFYFKKALKMSRSNGFQQIESMCINNLGMYHWNRSEYNLALDYFFQALKMDEANDNEQSTSYALNNIGLIYQEMNLNEKALAYHQRALAIRKTYNLENDQIASLNNIGINLKDLGRIDDAIASFKQGIALAKKTNNTIDHFKLLDNLANAYQISGALQLALQTHLEALNKIDDYGASKTNQLATISNIIALYNRMDKPRMALQYIEKGKALMASFPQAELGYAELYLNSAESYYMLDDFKNARKDRDHFITLKDSVFSERNAKAIADLEVKYETDKKEREILIQRAELAEHKLTIQQKNYQLYGLIGLAFIFGLIGFLFYNQQKLKNQQLQKENELKDALVKIETQNKLQEQRLQISRDLHDNIGAQLTFIISSIDNIKYGFHIEDDKLNQKLSAISAFASSTIYELRDTIWAMNKNDISLEDLQVRISNFIDKAIMADSNIDFSFKVSESVNQEKMFSAIEGMNIYRVLQEAINNAIKHASAKTISVTVEQSVNNIKFQVSDNGIGFDLVNVQQGNGLNNMRKRIHSLGGEIQIDSLNDKGTRVTLII